MSWLEALRHTKVSRDRSRKSKGYDPNRHDQCLYDIASALTHGCPKPKVAQQMSEALYDLRAASATCRHDSMRDHTMSLLRHGSNGVAGVAFAITELRAAFRDIVGPDREPQEAEAEFERLITGAGHLLDEGRTGADSANTWPSPSAPRVVAQRVVAVFARRPLVFYGQDFYRWDGAAYRFVDDNHLRSDLYLLLQDAYCWAKTGKTWTAVGWNPKKGNIDAVVDALKVRPVLLGADVRPSRWITDQGELSPRDDQVIACANGLLRVSDRTLLDPSPQFFNTFALPFARVAAAGCPRWLLFLDEILPGDKEARDLLQEWFGCIISGRTDLQKALMVIGATRSGKGTIDRVIRALVGEENHTGLSGSDLTGPFGLEDLIPKTVATFSDERMTMNGKKFVEIFLRITGEDPVTVNQKNKKPWVGRLGTRLQLMSNEFPTLPDNSGAIVGRFLVLYLTQSFFGREDTTLMAKLTPELPGILNWALEGLDRLNAKGRFTEVTSSAKFIAEMREASSPQNLFIAEMTTPGPNLWEPQSSTFTLWKAWCRVNNHDPGTQHNLTKKLQTALGPDVYNPNVKKDVGRKRVRVYLGFEFSLTDTERLHYINNAYNRWVS